MRKYCEWKNNLCLESKEFGFILCVSTVSGFLLLSRVERVWFYFMRKYCEYYKGNAV